MFNTVLLIVAAGMAAWNVYRLIKRPDSVAVVTVLFWALLLWRILSPLDWHISVLAGLLLLKVILAQRRHSRNDGDVALGRKSQEASQRGSGASVGSSSHKNQDEGADDNESDDVDAEEEDEALAKEERVTLATTPVGSPLSVRFVTTEAQTFPTTSGEPLQITAGEHSGTLALRSPESPEIDEALEEGYTARLNAEFTYHGLDGSRWRCEKALWAGTILSLERIADSESRMETRFWREAPQEMQRVFRERCLVAQHPVADDGRVRFPLQVGPRQVVVMTKYLAWKVDLALDPDERRVWVRVSELLEEIWDGDVFGPDGDSAEWKDIKRTPAFYYSLPVEDFLPGLGIGIESADSEPGELGPENDDEDDDQAVFSLVET